MQFKVKDFITDKEIILSDLFLNNVDTREQNKQSRKVKQRLI